MKKIMHILLLSCLKATELIEKRLHFKLSWTENIQLKVHKMMCSACNNYEKQSEILEKSIAAQSQSEITEEEVLELKNLIKRKLDQ